MHFRTFILGLFLGCAFSSVGLVRIALGSDFRSGKCASEAQTYCVIYGFKGRRLQKCLLDNENRLTPGCVESKEYQALLTARAKGVFRPKVTRKCLTEAKRVCKDYGKKLTSKTIQTCLDKAEIGVSLKCREQLDQWVISARTEE